MAQNQVNFSLKSLLCILIWTSTLTKASGKQREFLFGKCELYAGSTCKEFLQGKRIYMKNYLSQNVLERRIATWLQTAKRTKSISNSCWPHARVLICYHTFPVCEGAGSSLRSRPFCQDECKYLETSVCRKEFLLAKSIAAIRHYVPSCSNLPRPGTPQYANCWRLPSLDKSKYPRGISVAYRRNFTVSDTERASLKCYFNLYNLGQRTQKPIRMTWYKYDDNVLKRGGKYRMKRRKRGEFRIISTLIIKSATMSDSGLYHCVAKQGEKSVKSEVYLTVTKRKLSTTKGKTVKDGRKSQGPKSTLRKTPEKYSFGNGLGNCAPYRGTACAKYLKQGKNSHVFEYSYSPQTLVEKRLIREFRRIKEAGVFSKRCEEIGLAIMCYNVFNACNKSSNTPVSRLCQDDCYLFDKVLCKYEVELASKHSSAFEFLPDCSLLPNKNPLCEPVAIPQMRLWTAENDTQCYNGTGKDYKGIVNVSKTGRRCKPWKEFSPVYKFSHNYCRNYGGENYAPWCYVGNGIKEFCAVQRCSGQDMDSALDSSAIPVIPTDTGCYIGKGENYQGLVKSSKSDRLCLRWSMMGSYTARHNYCRNYGGKRDAPWCFVSRTEKEYCNIPKCDQNAQPVKSDNNPPSLVYYVIPVAIALSVLLLVVLVLLVYLKHRKKANADTRPPSQTKETSRPVNTIRIDKDEVIGPPIPEQMDKASSDNVPEVDVKSLNYLELVGQNYFIEIWHAELSSNELTMPSKEYATLSKEFTRPLIVKRLSSGATTRVVNELNQEIRSLRNLRHGNLINLACMSLSIDAPFIVFDALDLRDLKHRLRVEASTANQDSLVGSSNYDFVVDLALQISKGMEYLHGVEFIHKELRTRNCLISSNNIVKIVHFGLGKYEYCKLNNLLVPIRWKSPESLQTLKFTKENDIWSFGVLVWELLSHSRTPYSDRTDEQALDLIMRHELLPCPSECPASLYSLTKECWAIEPSKRPGFAEIQKILRHWSSSRC